MNKTLKMTFAVLATFAALTACSTKDPLAPDDSKIQGTDSPTNPTQGVELTGVLESGNKTAWSTADKVLIFDGASSAVVSPAAISTSAGLSCSTLENGATYYLGYWPAEDSPAITDNLIQTSVPAVQAGVENIYDIVKLAGKTHTERLAFDDIFSYVGFSTTMEGIEKMVISSDGIIAGDVEISYESTAPEYTITNGSSTIEVTGPFEANKIYYFYAAPGFNGEINAVAKTAAKDYEIEAVPVDFMIGKVNLIPAMDEPCPLVGVYQIAHMWVHGGTGLEYGAGGVRDLFAETPASKFVSSLGRGVEAELDNYIEVLQDGTMYNWAGEDGSNCRFVWKSSENRKQKGYPIELESFFRVLPKDPSHIWMDDEGVVTITLEDGSTVTGQYCPAGEYPNYNGGQTVTITTAAIKFTISGGTDDWTNLWNYKEWDIIASHPRALYIELTPLGKKFEVPEAAKTVESIPEDEVLDPDEPVHGSFNFDEMPGTWGFESVTSDCVVLGGCSSDPAFVGPVDKSWDWNDSIWKLGDDRLEITKEGDDLYFNYWSGDDGLFWDCVWNSTGEDLSKYYGQLPKGKHKMILNKDTYELSFEDVSFAEGVTAKFYEPGTYQFSEFKKEATIDDGCFGIWFDFGAPSGGYPENSSHWNDIDRFVYSPHGYLMKFHKF